MSYNNKKNNFFLNKHLRHTRFSRNSFSRCQLSYFALANIWLHRHDSFFRFTLLLSGDININLRGTTVTNNSIPLNTLPFHNHDEPTMPSEWNSLGCYKAHDKKGLHVLHLNIDSLKSMKFVYSKNNQMLL